jgi:hypothetical protein
MSLEQWVEIRVLRAEPTSSEEVKALIGVVETRLNDARVELISDDWRFAAAYNALLTSATIALRAKGYRVPNQAGHHTRALESLEFTIGADDTLIHVRGDWRGFSAGSSVGNQLGRRPPQESHRMATAEPPRTTLANQIAEITHTKAAATAAALSLLTLILATNSKAGCEPAWRPVPGYASAPCGGVDCKTVLLP